MNTRDDNELYCGGQLPDPFEDLEPWAETPPEIRPSQPEVRIGADFGRVVDEALGHLTKHPNVYQWNNRLVLVERVADPGIPLAITPLRTQTLRKELSRTCAFLRLKQEGRGSDCTWVPYEVPPPKDVADCLLQQSSWEGIRPLTQVVQTPTIRPDGSILETPGYDDATGIYYEQLEAWPPIPTSPTREDCMLAAQRILDVVKDFPFKSAADRSTYLGAVMTPFALAAINGPIPLTMIEAPTSRTGKSLLAGVIGTIVGGAKSIAKTPPFESDAECAKSILAFALRGVNAVLIDNCAGDVGWPSLDMAITAERTDRRLLGTNEVIGVSTHFPWYGTANNPNYKHDIVGRMVIIGLDAGVERPEERTGFEHSDLLGWTLANRPALVTDILTIFRGFFAAGCPAPSSPLKHFGGFEAWTRLIRHLIVWLGLPDPIEARDAMLEKRDNENHAWQRLFYVLFEAFKARQFTARDIQNHTVVKEALEELAPEGRILTNQAIGILLRKAAEQVHAGLILTNPVRSGRDVARWKMEVHNAKAYEAFAQTDLSAKEEPFLEDTL